MGHQDPFLRPRVSARCGFREETFAGTRVNGRDAPFPDVRRRSGTDELARIAVISRAAVIVPIENLWWPVSITV
jgi:hypothetical protein